MSYKIINFRNAGEIIKEKKMTKEVKQLMEYLHDCLYGTRYKSELLRQALTEMNWRQNGDLNVLDGRRYFYKGFRNRIAIDGSFSSYEYIQDALLRLQVGFDKGKIDMGIVMVTSQRSEKSKLGTTEELVAKEIEMLKPTINLPITIVLFDLGKSGEIYEEKDNKKEEPISEKLTDQKVIDKYLHGDQGKDNHVNSNTKQKKRKKPNVKSRKPVLQDSQQAA
jgi:hypothetical protein